MPTPRDPREIITPAAFTVAPDLLGLPLARPWRRAAAILIDLALGGTLVGLVHTPSIFFASVAAVLVFRWTRRRSERAQTLLRRAYRMVMRGILALLLFVVGVAILEGIRAQFRGAAATPETTTSDGAVVVDMPLRELGITVADGVALWRASSPAEADLAAARIRDRFDRNGLGAGEARDILNALDEVDRKTSDVNPLAINALRRVLEPLASEPAEAAPGDADSVALAYAAALAAGDSGRATTLRPVVGEAPAGEQIDRLEQRNRRLLQTIDELERDNETLEQERDDARGGVSITRFIRNAIDDLGLGLGWLMLYFTAFTAIWRGRTPGKRLLGIRVIRLDGQPIGWWLGFERFGGYSAALATGLLGFAQILWDRNRQAIHDKIASTVVIRERGAARSVRQKSPGGA